MAKKRKAVKKTAKKKVARKKLTKKTVKKKAAKKAVKKPAKKKAKVIKKIIMKQTSAAPVTASAPAPKVTAPAPAVTSVKPSPKKKYKCAVCGKTMETNGSEFQAPICCGRPMAQMPMDSCTDAPSAEQSRLFNDDDACDDGRGGNLV